MLYRVLGTDLEKKQKYLWIINLSGALLNVALNYFMISAWGIVGASVASALSSEIPKGYIAYGRLPLMVTENCLFFNRTGECSCQRGSMKLMDKTGAEFPVIKDGGSCRSVLLNGKKLSWLDRQEDLAQLGLWAVRLYFTTENPKEVDRILTAFVNAAPFDPGACTRGLYLRGLD